MNGMPEIGNQEEQPAPGTSKRQRAPLKRESQPGKPGDQGGGCIPLQMLHWEASDEHTGPESHSDGVAFLRTGHTFSPFP